MGFVLFASDAVNYMIVLGKKIEFDCIDFTNIDHAIWNGLLSTRSGTAFCSRSRTAART